MNNLLTLEVKSCIEYAYAMLLQEENQMNSHSNAISYENTTMNV